MMVVEMDKGFFVSALGEMVTNTESAVALKQLGLQQTIEESAVGKHYSFSENVYTHKVQMKDSTIITAGVYPSWHPQENLIAFSTNKTGQAFHLYHPEKIEVPTWSSITQSSLLITLL